MVGLSSRPAKVQAPAESWLVVQEPVARAMSMSLSDEVQSALKSSEPAWESVNESKTAT